MATSALSLRISDKDKSLIDRAAAATHKTRTQFMVDSARAAALDAVLDQTVFVVSDKEFKAFEKALVKAPHVDDILAELGKRQNPWRD